VLPRHCADECLLFLPEAGLTSLDKLAREQKAEERFLALLARYERDGRNVSDKLRFFAVG
jgi:hypothetical protein